VKSYSEELEGKDDSSRDLEIPADEKGHDAVGRVSSAIQRKLGGEVSVLDHEGVEGDPLGVSVA
jgi:hypothetical protein